MSNPPSPINDPVHWARAAYNEQPSQTAVRLVRRALELFLEYQDLKQGEIYLDWEAAIIAQGESPCIERGVVLSGDDKKESPFAFIVCSQCQNQLAAMVRAFWFETYVPSHPEWQPPNSARLLQEIDGLIERARQAAEEAERLRNPQMVLFGFDAPKTARPSLFKRIVK